MGKTPSKSNHYIIILCGGSGPRLWPLSRASNPKQFLDLLGDGSLLTQTIKRSLKIVPSENLFLISNKKYKTQVLDHTHGLIPAHNILLENQKKNTAMAILYGCAVIHSLNPHAVVTTFPSDHFIKGEKNFIADIKLSAKISIDLNSIVALGTPPTSPNPSYGYMVASPTQHKYLKVKKFIEKPPQNDIFRLLKTRHSYWNIGIYTFTIDGLVGEFTRLQPEYSKLYTKLLDDPFSPKIVEKVYSLSPNLPIDIAISQKTNRLTLLPGSFAWSDVGEWKTIHSQLKKDKNGISVLKPDTNFVQYNSSDCLLSVNGKKLIGLVNVSDLAIIDTPDSLLVCKLSDSFYVRDLVGNIVKNKKSINYFLKQTND